MIFLALLVWLGTQALSYLEPMGAPRFLASGLVASGLVALPTLLLWPWLKGRFLRIEETELRASWKSKEARRQALISGEIAALSAMLIFLVAQMPR